MAKNKNEPVEFNEKEWQAENDAYILLDSERIKLDPKRLSAAQKKAADIIKKQAEEAKKNIQIAKKFSKTKTAKKGKK
jgi:hypothetical protein